MTHVIAVGFVLLTHQLFLPTIPVVAIVALCLAIEAHRFFGRVVQ